MVAKEGIGTKILDTLLSYETIKIVTIKNKKVGFLHRLVQLAILGYVIGYAIIWKKGYQEFDQSLSAVTTKLKGVALANFSTFESPLLNGMHIFDSADYVIPPQENNEFFVMTNMIITPNQTRGRCPEDPRFEDVYCQRDSDCREGEAVANGNGVKTGKCVQSDQNITAYVCQIYGWCPVELDVLPMPGHGFKKGDPLLQSAVNFTVLIKNQVTFPKFGFARRNIISQNNTTYLKSCNYHHESDPFCPIFKLGTIVSDAGYDFNDIAYKGGIVAIQIKWECNLDVSEDKCRPQYSFKRIDDPHAPIASGFNFRFAQYYVENNKQHRILYKAYGIKFEVLVNGRATIWCDIIVLYCLKDRQVYRSHKYHKVVDGDEPTDTDDDGDLNKGANVSEFAYQKVEDENDPD
eukprot:gene15414-6655_t